jgi:molybdate/tungstate transport system substrate-binding protein
VASAAAAPHAAPPAAPSRSPAHGTASVAYAGSLELLASTVLGPKFEAATGDEFQGRGAGSTTLAQEILSGEISPGVFMSVGRKALEMLWPKRSRFAIQLATDPLVVAYNPKGKYAARFAAIAGHKQPLSSLFNLLNTSGLRIGRTDPNADPQGVFFILMMELAQKTLGLSFDPAATALGVSKASPFGKTSQMVDEDSLISDLQAGELDASSAYLSQAVQSHLPYIALPPSLNFSVPSEAAHYATVSITLTNKTVDQGELITLDETLVQPPTPATAPSAADQAADNAFASFLLSPAGRTDLGKGGYDLTGPVFFGATPATTPSKALPKDLLSAFTAAGGTQSAG